MNSARVWSPTSRVAFRFAFAYVAIYATYIVDQTAERVGSLFTSADVLLFPAPLLHLLVPWFAKNVLHTAHDIVVFSNGSGDTTYDWVLVLCNLLLAILAAAAWSMLDRRRSNYEHLYAWTLFGVRLLLAEELVQYAFDKVIPAQFGPLTLTRMIQPFGALSPMGALWASMSASTGYTVFAGSIELLAAVLLLIPRSTTLGALIAVGALTNIFVLNLFYDVPVKLFSLHLLLLAIFLVIPDLKRLANVLLLNRATEPSPPLALAGNPAVARVAIVASWVIGVAFSGAMFDLVLGGYTKRLASIDPSTPFYGIWSVDTVAAEKPAAEAAAGWHYLVFESPGKMWVESDGDLQPFTLVPEPGKPTMTLAGFRARSWASGVDLHRIDPRHLVLRGTVAGAPFRLTAHALDVSQMNLSDRSLHWISEYPR